MGHVARMSRSCVGGQDHWTHGKRLVTFNQRLFTPRAPGLWAEASGAEPRAVDSASDFYPSASGLLS